MTLKETVRTALREILGEPEGQAALRDAIVPAPASKAPSARSEMTATERKALGAELATAFATVTSEGVRLRNAVTAAWARLSAAQSEHARLGAEQGELASNYCARRDPIMARLWAERPALADELIAQVETEARSLRSESYALPEEGLGGQPMSYGGRAAVGEIVRDDDLSSMPRNVSNGASVEARRKGLYSLAENIKEWTTKGLFATVAELQAMFDGEYSALPKAESLREVMQRDARARKFIRPSATWPAPAA